MYAGFLALAEAPIPTIAAVCGPTIGAAVNLPLACDVVLTAESARFHPRFLDVMVAVIDMSSFGASGVGGWVGLIQGSIQSLAEPGIRYRLSGDLEPPHAGYFRQYT